MEREPPQALLVFTHLLMKAPKKPQKTTTTKKTLWVKPSQSRLFYYFKKLKAKWATSKPLLQKILPAGDQNNQADKCSKWTVEIYVVKPITLFREEETINSDLLLISVLANNNALHSKFYQKHPLDFKMQSL